MTTWTINGRTQDDSFVFRSGLRMQVTPEGDCRECTFVAQGQGLGLHPLDTVAIACDGVPLFYGEVRVGGNPADLNGHQFTVRSLVLRLKEVAIPEGWSTPQQNATTTVWQLIQAVLPQLGGTITIGAINLPFDCRAVIDANQQDPYSLLEQIASDGAGLGVKVKFGVNARREFFCLAMREDVVNLTDDMVTGAVSWSAPVSENPVTAVLWYVAKKPDGSWLKHLSIAPEASVYGQRIHRETLENDTGLWINVNGEISYLASQDGQTLQSVAPAQALDPNIIANPNNTVISTATFNAQASQVQMPFTQPPDRIVAEFSTAKTFPGSTVETPTLRVATIWINNKFVENRPGNLMLYPSYAATSITLDDSQLFYQVDASGKAGALYKATESLIHVRQLRGEVLNTALLDRLANYFYNIPATQPADIEVLGIFGNRAGYVTWRDWQSPVDAYEYRITAERGLCTGIMAGQADDPESLARAALIKARDGRAVIKALTSKE